MAIDIKNGKVIEVSTPSRDVADFLIGFVKSQPINEHSETLLRWALELVPGHAMAFNGLGSVFMSKRDFLHAVDYYGYAIDADLSNPAYLVNQAKALRGLGKYDDAIDNLHTVIQNCEVPRGTSLHPALVEAYTELAGIYTELDDLVLYEAALMEALALAPTNPMLIRARGALAMLNGKTELGWHDWEFRADALRLRKEMDEYEEWTGQDLTGKSIRVCMEQGMGDAIMFIRYLIPLMERCSHLVLETQSPLARLFGQYNDRAKRLFLEVVSRVQDGKECDYWIPLASLPRMFGSYVGPEPYLYARSDDVDRFAKLIPRSRKCGMCNGTGEDIGAMCVGDRPKCESCRGTGALQDSNLKVGLCWRGSKDHLNDKFRSMPFEAFHPLLDVPGCTFYSLQAGMVTTSQPTPGNPDVMQNIQSQTIEGGEYRKCGMCNGTGRDIGAMCVGERPPCLSCRGTGTLGLFNLIDYCHDFADTAAAIANLDLVITCDTAVAHVAGAIGKPVWIIVGKPTDWRWGLEGDTTDWYPSARLFRAAKPLEWPVGWVTAALRSAVQNHCAPERLMYPEGAAYFNPAIGQSDLEAISKAKPLTDISVDCMTYAGDGVITRPCKHGLMSFYHNDKYIGRSLDLYGEFSEDEVDLFRLILKYGDVVVDAGANIGALTMPLSKIVGDKGRVYAFEPQPRYANLLDKNLEYTDNVWFYNVALGAEPKALKLKHVPTDCIHAPGWESDQPEFEVAQITLDGEFRIQGITSVDFIKIDVDGQELEILQGAEQTINRCRPIMYVENDKPQKYIGLIPWLTAHGYRVYEHRPPLYNPNNFNSYKVNVFEDIVSLMILCIPQENKQWRLSTLPAGMRRVKQ